MSYQLETGATCNVISHRNVAQLLQDGDPRLRKSNPSQVQLLSADTGEKLGLIKADIDTEESVYVLKSSY